MKTDRETLAKFIYSRSKIGLLFIYLFVCIYFFMSLYCMSIGYTISDTSHCACVSLQKHIALWLRCFGVSHVCFGRRGCFGGNQKKQ